MINRVGSVTIYVTDQARAKDFYVNTLGFELLMDVPYNSQQNWVSVAPAGAETEIVLSLIDEYSQHYAATIGNKQSLVFNVSNIQETYADLKSKGVQFYGEPQFAPFGANVFMLDPDGNAILLVEPPQM